MTAAPINHHCRDKEFQLVDIVQSYDADEDVLLVARGGECSDLGWATVPYHVDYPASGGIRTARAARPVTAVAVDPAGTWWVGAGGTVYSSTDRGAHWKRGTFDASSATNPWTAGIAWMGVDAKKPGVVVVQTIEREVMGAPVIGGYVQRSSDGGATWKAVRLPQDLSGYREEEGQPAEPHEWMEATFAIGDSADHLTAWGKKYGDEPNAEPKPATWQTVDGGASWRLVATTPPPTAREARAGTTQLRASPDGLLVIDAGKPPRRIYVP